MIIIVMPSSGVVLFLVIGARRDSSIAIASWAGPHCLLCIHMGLHRLLTRVFVRIF